MPGGTVCGGSREECEAACCTPAPRPMQYKCSRLYKDRLAEGQARCPTGITMPGRTVCGGSREECEAACCTPAPRPMQYKCSKLYKDRMAEGQAPCPTGIPMPPRTVCGGSREECEAACCAPAGAGPAWEQNVLNMHNKYRCMHGVQALTWDSAAAASAQSWANKKHQTLTHAADSDMNEPAGENIARGGSNMKALVTMWYNEVDLCANDKCDQPNFGTVGHYTAMIWKSVTRLGCGWDDDSQTLVCRYLYDTGPGSDDCNPPNMQYQGKDCYGQNVLHSKSPPQSRNDCSQGTNTQPAKKAKKAAAKKAKKAKKARKAAQKQ